MKLDPDSEDVKEKLADVAAVMLPLAGPAVIVVSGGVVSVTGSAAVIVQLALSLAESLPLVARTTNLCEPGANPTYCFGAAQLPKGPPSRLHVVRRTLPVVTHANIAEVSEVEDCGALVIATPSDDVAVR